MSDAVAALEQQKERLSDGTTWTRALDEVEAALQEALERTIDLLRPLDPQTWRRSPDPIMGPVAWDVAHMGNQEDIWLHQHLHGDGPLEPGSNETYHAYRNPRPCRALLPLKGPEALFGYRTRVRERTMARLDALREAPPATTERRWEVLYLHWMVALHEHQHTETLCQTLALYPSGQYRPVVHEPSAPSLEPAAARTLADSFVFHEGGTFRMGRPRGLRSYDNEWPPHEVEVPPFWLSAAPVTNEAWLRFIEADGYECADVWDAGGQEKVLERGWRHPQTWVPTPEGWRLREADRLVPLPLDRPVMGITWYEADAYARWRGLRLPTEAEWEFAATTAPASTSAAPGPQRRPYPWGQEAPDTERCNMDQRRWGTDPIGSRPQGASARGVHQLIGDVWEWTATDFDAYPGFEPYPYPEYSACFFDKRLKVLRGGSWATRPGLRLGTFRNWDLPIRRQNFAGLRLASDEAPDPSR